MTRQRPFRFGVGAIPFQSATELIDFARKVEDLGFSTLSGGDHPAWGGFGQIPLLTAAAAGTTKLRLASHVFANDFRQPALLAAEAAMLDVLSDGRLEFGIGAGWLRSDYSTIGLPFDPPAARIQRLEEAVPLIKRLFGDEAVTHSGRSYRVEGMNLDPKPKQRPHPPIFIGGGGRRVLSLAAREADIVGIDMKGTAAGTKDMATSTEDFVAQQIGWVREAAGTRFDALELQLLVFAIKVTDDRRQAAEEVAAELADLPPGILSNLPTVEHILESPQFLVGSVTQIVEELQALRERYGISYITAFGEYVDAFSPIVARLAGT
jgi:probable F420-dependent oxidoreductase